MPTDPADLRTWLWRLVERELSKSRSRHMDARIKLEKLITERRVRNESGDEYNDMYLGPRLDSQISRFMGEEKKSADYVQKVVDLRDFVLETFLGGEDPSDAD